MGLVNDELKRWKEKDEGRNNATGWKKTRMKTTTVHFTNYQVSAMDKLVEKDIFPNRAELVRNAVMDVLLAFKDIIDE